MLHYDAYFRMFGLRRETGLVKVHSFSELEELPVGAVIHDLSCIKKPISKETSPVPSEEHLFRLCGKKRLMVYPEINYKLPEDCPYFEQVGGIRGFSANTLQKVRTIKSQKVLLVKSPLQLQSSATLQAKIIYDPVFASEIRGTFPVLRMFNLLFGRLFTNISQLPDMQHFILLPTDNFMLNRVSFERVMSKGYIRMAYKTTDSYYYLFMAHLYGFLYDKPNDNVFAKLNSTLLDKINIIFVNENTDRCVHYRVDKLKEFVSKQTTLRRVLDTLNIVAKEVTLVGKDVGEIDEAVQTVPDTLKVGAPAESGNKTAFKEQLSEKELIEKAKDRVVEVRKETIKKIAENKDLTPAQKTAAVKNAETYTKLEVNGTPVVELVSTPTVKVAYKKNDVSDVVDVPDKSVTKSTMATFSKDYMENSFKRDMASTLTNFSKVGMHVVDISTEDLSDSLNQVERYTVKFKDNTGKQHTIKYRIPKVDENGNCLINGSLKRLSIQRINLPICKLSDTRVSLSSSANKTIVERQFSFSNSLVKQIRRYIEKTNLPIKVSLGSNSWPDITLPSGYSDIASIYKRISGLGIEWVFDYPIRLPKDETKAQQIIAVEKQYNAVYLGTFKNTPCYMDLDNKIHWDGNVDSILGVLSGTITDVPFTPYDEWVNVFLLDKKFPLIFLLSYRYGFETMLKYMKVPYEKISTGMRTNATVRDVVIRMSDITFIIRNASTLQRYIFSGLNYFDLKNIDHFSLEDQDIYFTLLESKGFSVEYLRGIDFLFDLFLDPITIDVLQQMGEPTNMRDLLIRSTVLLTTSEHVEVSSSTNFRYRSYEQFNAILYKTLARALSTYQNRSIGYKNSFSINEYEVFTNIVTDSLFNNINVVNPIATIKDGLHYTHIGDGGRSKDTMMLPDRRYPKDGVGIMSEATPDSSNTGVDGILTVNPSITNTRGLCVPKKAKDVSNSELLSPTALLYPGATQDDPKRRFVRL